MTPPTGRAAWWRITKRVCALVPIAGLVYFIWYLGFLGGSHQRGPDALAAAIDAAIAHGESTVVVPACPDEVWLITVGYSGKDWLAENTRLCWNDREYLSTNEGSNAVRIRGRYIESMAPLPPDCEFGDMLLREGDVLSITDIPPNSQYRRTRHQIKLSRHAEKQ